MFGRAECGDEQLVLTLRLRVAVASYPIATAMTRGLGATASTPSSCLSREHAAKATMHVLA